ncbi:MAG: low specificity L-threonine aldolase, partial [candidate division Zixibacteria bacterium]|nr:low specificity L-threonine aldolase [candidate division Zixibacteria bacterium]
SKGLGAPVGSVVLGSAEFIERCRRERKLFGGAMRQVGIIAAGGLWAVQHNIERLAEDHANARLLAEGLNKLDLFDIDLSRVETNIVIAELTGPEDSAAVVEKMKKVDVLAVPFGPKKIRFVPHLDVTSADCEEALARIESAFG